MASSSKHVVALAGGVCDELAPIARDRRNTDLLKDKTRMALSIAGVALAVMLILLQIVVQNGLNENLALSRTMVIVFAGIFNCVVLWDIYGVSPFSPRSFLVHWQATLAGVILAALVALIPVYLLTSTLGFERLDGVHWLILFAGLALAYIAIYFVQSRPAAARLAHGTWHSASRQTSEARQTSSSLSSAASTTAAR